jgi:ubiquinone/menaquinone biosynthesis methyltransferase
MSVDDRIATPDGKRRYVRSLFATIADRYDLITRILSYGRDTRWKQRLIDIAGPARGVRALDLATGTGDIAFGIHRRAARVVGLDVTPRMIHIAKAKAADRRMQPSAAAGVEPVFLVGDMVALPFSSASFDLVTTGYGLRNVPDLGVALDEILRVLKPGGQALSLDFNKPSNRFVRASYLMYLTMVGGALGWILHRDPDTYRYIPASIRRYPGADGVARMMEARGFVRVRQYPLLGGLMAIHHAYRPA